MSPLEAMLLRLGVIAALILANGFFVAAEFALVSVRRSRLDELAAQGNTSAHLVRQMMGNPTRFIAAIQVSITIAGLGLGWLGEPALVQLVEPVFAFLPSLWAGVASHSVATGFSFALITFVLIVLGELVPKSIALQNPEATAFMVARPTLWTERIFRPFIWLLHRTSSLVLRIIGLRATAGQQAAHSVEELKILVRDSHERGMLEPEEQRMLVRVFEFSDRAVREVMIPRTAVVGIARTEKVEALLCLFAEHRHARFPIYEGDLDHVVGMVAVKDILVVLAEIGPAARQRTLEEVKLIRPAFFVPESRRVGDLLPEMRANRVQMAIVLDEFGGTAGLVTIEELIEEVVGRVSDEGVSKPPPIKPVSAGRWEVDALIRVDELNAELELQLPERPEYETVAGFLLWLMRRVPQQGDEAAWQGLTFRVLQMKGPKIERVCIARLTQASSQAGTGLRSGASE